MPSTITHSYIGIDTQKILKEKPQNILNNHLDNYKIYCQSMDVLYFYHILLLKDNPTVKIGHTFHRKKTFESFKFIIDILKKNKDEELFTFLCGLISHYKADSIIHPFVNYLAYNKDKLKHTDNHFEIESYLDNYFINKYEKGNYKKIKCYQLVFNYQEKEIIKETIDSLFENIFDTKNIGKKYYKALKEMQFVYKHFRYDPTKIKHFLYQIIDINHLKVRRTKYLSYNFELNKNDYFLNNNHKEWYNIRNKNIKSKESLEELYNKVINETKDIINELYDYIYENKKIDLQKVIGNNSYSTGLPL